MNWEDETAYSNTVGEHQGEIDPRTWATYVNGVQVIVTRHVYFPETWVLLCRYLHLDLIDLHTDDIEKAKANALAKIRQTIEERVGELQEILKELQ